MLVEKKLDQIKANVKFLSAFVNTLAEQYSSSTSATQSGCPVSISMPEIYACYVKETKEASLHCTTFGRLFSSYFIELIYSTKFIHGQKFYTFLPSKLKTSLSQKVYYDEEARLQQGNMPAIQNKLYT